MAQITLEDLLARKESQQTQQTALVYLPGLGGELEIQRIPLARYMGLTGQFEADAPDRLLGAQYELIYACCPILRNPQLQEAYACREPVEIVGKVLNENLGDMNLLVTEISKFYGLNFEESLKN